MKVGSIERRGAAAAALIGITVRRRGCRARRRGYSRYPRPDRRAPRMGAARNHRRRFAHRLGGLCAVALAAQPPCAQFCCRTKSPCSAWMPSARSCSRRARGSSPLLRPTLFGSISSKDSVVTATRRTTEEFLRDLLESSNAALARHQGLLAEFLAAMRLRKIRGPVADSAEHGVAAAKCPCVRFGNRKPGNTHDSLPAA